MRDWDTEIVAGFRRALKISGRTIRSISGSTGIPYRSLQNYLSGTSKMPAAVFVALCEDLGINSDYLMYGNFGLQHSTLTDALWRAMGEAALHGKPTNLPIQMAKLTSEQRKKLGEASVRVNKNYDAGALMYVGQLAAELEADEARLPADDEGDAEVPK